MIYLYLIAINLLIVYAEPVILLRRLIGFKEEDFNTMSKYKRFFFKLITCSGCIGFWISLLVLFNPLQAVLISVLTTIVENKLYRG